MKNTTLGWVVSLFSGAECCLRGTCSSWRCWHLNVTLLFTPLSWFQSWQQTRLRYQCQVHHFFLLPGSTYGIILAQSTKSPTSSMGRKKIQISRIGDERNRQVCVIWFLCSSSSFCRWLIIYKDSTWIVFEEYKKENNVSSQSWCIVAKNIKWLPSASMGLEVHDTRNMWARHLLVGSKKHTWLHYVCDVADPSSHLCKKLITFTHAHMIKTSRICFNCR